MSIIGSNILAGASGQGGGGYTIENSLRLRSSASAYLSRTPASAGNRRTWTWSGWVKVGAIGQWEGIFNAGSSGNQFAMYLYTDSTLYIQDYTGSNNIYLQTSQVFRDPSAWYHIVFAVDTTQVTSTNRFKLYVNGSQVTSFVSTTYPSQNYDTQVNSTSYQNNIGVNYQFGTSNAKYFDGYMTEVNFIDGQALTPSDFGEYNATTGVWQPAKYTGTYGTNGFYLPFSDATNTTTLVADSSGNGNDWTPNNISLTSGVTYDSMTDTPTIYADGGNYAVLNPIGYRTTAPTPTISNANLKVVCPSASGSSIGVGSFGVSSGKWYWEVTKTGTAYGNTGIVLSPFDMAASGSVDLGYYSNEYVYINSGLKYNNNATSAYGASWTNNDVIGVALDLDAGTLVFYKNGTSQGTAFSSLPSGTYMCGGYDSYNGSGFEFNFGQRPFAYTPPTGFLPLHTGNLPDSAIVDGSTAFDVVFHTGNGGSLSVTGLEFQPDFVWSKARNTSSYHRLHDVVRGSDNTLATNETDEEVLGNGIVSFDTDGFTLDSGSNINQVYNYVDWAWKANGAGVSNTDGTVAGTVTVSANTTAGFSIVTWTNPASGTPTIGHGLGVAPSFIIVKDRTFAYNWDVGSDSIGWANRLNLNTIGASPSSGFWNSTAPTASVFTYAASGGNSGDSMVAYCFSEVHGYSSFGSYVGNANPDGPFVFLGFRPSFVITKSADATAGAGDWTIHDTSRRSYNTNDLRLFANEPNSESTGEAMDMLSNGFKIRATNSNCNTNNGKYIYMAFAENPFKNSLAR